MICSGLSGGFELADASQRQQAVEAIVEFGTNLCNAYERQKLLHSLGQKLGIDSEALERAGCLKLMNPQQIREASATGIDIQLHTHRHTLSDLSASAVRQEIQDNRRALETITGDVLSHFCYPSGHYNLLIWPVLRELGIETAATCLTGFNYPSTPKMELRRILDAEFTPLIEFEAELCGFLEILRRARSYLLKTGWHSEKTGGPGETLFKSGSRSFQRNGCGPRTAAVRSDGARTG